MKTRKKGELQLQKRITFKIGARQFGRKILK